MLKLKELRKTVRLTQALGSTSSNKPVRTGKGARFEKFKDPRTGETLYRRKVKL